MTATRNALSFARPVLTWLVYLNLLYALGILALLVVGLVRPEWAAAPVGFVNEGSHPLLIVGLRSIMIVGLVGAGIVHLVLRQLLAIVQTVRDGDPFIAENARRLTLIAWCVLAGEALRWIVIAISSAISTPAHGVQMGGDFSFAPWLAVLLLFVLAGVFAQGARMRADLEGTV